MPSQQAVNRGPIQPKPFDSFGSFAAIRDRGPTERVILFGSKARGDDDSESDIDLLGTASTKQRHCGFPSMPIGLRGIRDDRRGGETGHGGYRTGICGRMPDSIAIRVGGRVSSHSSPKRQREESASAPLKRPTDVYPDLVAGDLGLHLAE